MCVIVIALVLSSAVDSPEEVASALYMLESTQLRARLHNARESTLHTLNISGVARLSLKKESLKRPTLGEANGMVTQNQITVEVHVGGSASTASGSKGHHLPSLQKT